MEFFSIIIKLKNTIVLKILSIKIKFSINVLLFTSVNTKFLIEIIIFVKKIYFIIVKTS
jgi:hypothetical protein